MTTSLSTYAPAPSAHKLEQAVAAVEALSDQIDAKNVAPAQGDVTQLKAAMENVKTLREVVRREDIEEAKRFLAQMGTSDALGAPGRTTGIGERGAWAKVAADRLTKSVGDFGIKALTTGGIDVPQPVESRPVIMPVEPRTVLDLLINRQPLTGNTYEYLRQTVRDNLAAPVADGATKPTSVYTFVSVEDRRGCLRICLSRSRCGTWTTTARSSGSWPTRWLRT